nr:alpha/beta hydrolases superfamily protein [Tanacetum cinerariifolium]
MMTEESKYLSSLALDEHIDNLKVHEVVMEKDSGIYRGKKERVKSMALKAKKESSEDETSTSRRNGEEYATMILFQALKSSLKERVNLLGNQKKKRRHSDKGMRRKERVIGNVLDAVIQIISLVIVQIRLATKIKRPSLEVL